MHKQKEIRVKTLFSFLSFFLLRKRGERLSYMLITSKLGNPQLETKDGEIGIARSKNPIEVIMTIW